MSKHNKIRDLIYRYYDNIDGMIKALDEKIIELTNTEDLDNIGKTHPERDDSRGGSEND